MVLLQRKYCFFFLFILSLGTGACSINSSDDTGEITTPDYSVLNSEEELSARLELRDEEVQIVTAGEDLQAKTVLTQESFQLQLIAEIEPPTVGGDPVQATMVSIFDDSPRAAVSYNARGAEYAGAIDILQLPSGNNNNLRIRSGVVFNDADVNAVHLNDSRVWAAQASDNPELVDPGEYSAVRQFSFSGFSISGESIVQRSIPGFAANSTKEFGDSVYTTSGDNAGLSVYNLELTEQYRFIEIEDARWVDVNTDWVIVLSGGDEGTIHKFSRSSLQLAATFPFPGADTPEAKNSVELVGQLALIAAGKSGTHIMDLSNGTILATIPIPDPDQLGLSPDVVETNAVSADGEFIFISNGEAGVYMAEASADLNQYQSGQNLTVQLSGQLQFENLQSVNHVSFRENILIIAAGLGGVKAVRVSQIQ